MIKKLLSTFLICSTMLCTMMMSPKASSYTDVADDAFYSKAVESLTTYGIISGYNGKFRPNANITRAEFSKMIALVTGMEDEVYSNAGEKKFDDVPLNHWATGHINTVAENKLLLGYPDGAFRPDKTITFAEAVTVVLRALDYSTEDLGDNWPYSYMVKGNSLGLTDGLNVSNNKAITRAELCVVLNKALETNLNRSQNKLLTKMDITITEELLIVATRNEDKSLASDEIKTDSGTYSLANMNLKFEPMSRVKLVLNNEKKIINFTESTSAKRLKTNVESVVAGEVYFANGSSTLSLGVSDNTSVYNNGTLFNYGNFKGNIEQGATAEIIFDENDVVRYMIFENAEYTQAVTIRTDVYSALKSVGVSKEKVDSANVVRNGYAATLKDAEIFDIAYYLSDNETIYLYSDKVSGVYNDAFPNKNNVTSVEISGTTLEIETQSAANKLGEKNGSYKLGSRLTALLGKDGKIVDVVDLNSSDRAVFGVLLEYGTDLSEDGEQYNYITFINGEGNTGKYKTNGNFKERIGDIGKINFDENGYVNFTTLTSNPTSVNGDIDISNRRIGDYLLTADCVIIDRTYAPDTRTGKATAQVIDLNDITVSMLSSNHVLYAVESGKFGDISLLIVENVIKDQYTYGILVSMDGRIGTTSANGTYNVFTDGSEKTYSASFYNKISSGTGVALQLDGNKLVSLKKLYAVETAVNVSAIDFSRVKIGSNVYWIDDNVQIVKRNGSQYMAVSKNNISDLVGKTVSLYADDAPSLGGMVRVIVVNN